jgi:hypothetical protein
MSIDHSGFWVNTIAALGYLVVLRVTKGSVFKVRILLGSWCCFVCQVSVNVTTLKVRQYLSSGQVIVGKSVDRSNFCVIRNLVYGAIHVSTAVANVPFDSIHCFRLKSQLPCLRCSGMTSTTNDCPNRQFRDTRRFRCPCSHSTTVYNRKLKRV